MKKALAFDTRRNGYGIDQIDDCTVTVRELINFLKEFPEDMFVVFKNDNGYTYGSINLDDTHVYKEHFDEEYGETEYIKDEMY